ncbi:sensor histidine kinase [Xylophilus rhododendri]|uniref:histidine kinase n=1 Tax=Xylophilus rhododendri TaxID=2697032 RepID=A0A857J3C9_9BURK|nr:ATP-binding protein [Xylophilus rhododendri]QHI97562.1 sensor histidine kinase [Xylophilus rhododendri]
MRAWLPRWPWQRPAHAYSLRRRLIASILGASVLVWSVSLGVVVYVAWHETSDVFDDALKETARLTLVLGASLQQHGHAPAADAAEEREPAKLRLYYQIVDGRGNILRRAAQAPSRPFSDALDERGDFRDVWVDGQAWRVYLARAKGQDFQVQVGQPWKKRLSLLTDVAEALAWPALALLLLLAGFCWWIIRRLLQPIEQTAGRIGAKSVDDLTPVPTGQVPRELLPIVEALNLVLGRLSRALQSERRFTADAAHELRTPLAALRMRIQLMQRQQAALPASAQPQADAVTLQSLRDEVDRCTGLVESLLALARLDPENPASLPRQPVDLPALLGSLRAEFRKEREIDLRLDCRVATLPAQPELLRTALRNLIDNALRYGPAEGPVSVEVQALAGRCRIAVRDGGPGVGAADRARLGERFFRVLGSGRTGHGLGLSIVARIAALHEARLSFEGGLGGRGLGVVLDFPLA